MVNLGRSSDLSVVGYISVTELTSYNIWVFGEGSEG